jgi:hypothetical protein
VIKTFGGEPWLFPARDTRNMTGSHESCLQAAGTENGIVTVCGRGTTQGVAQKEARI